MIVGILVGHTTGKHIVTFNDIRLCGPKDRSGYAQIAEFHLSQNDLEELKEQIAQEEDELIDALLWMAGGQMSKDLKALILEKEKQGKVVIATVDGLVEMDLNEMLKQPVEGLLYDLNRGRVTVLTFLGDEEKAILWVNNFACMKVITRLKEIMDEQSVTKQVGTGPSTKPVTVTPDE